MSNDGTFFVVLPGTTPIAKSPYRMGMNELEELKRQKRELLGVGSLEYAKYNGIGIRK